MNGIGGIRVDRITGVNKLSFTWVEFLLNNYC